MTTFCILSIGLLRLYQKVAKSKSIRCLFVIFVSKGLQHLNFLKNFTTFSGSILSIRFETKSGTFGSKCWKKLLASHISTNHCQCFLSLLKKSGKIPGYGKDFMSLRFPPSYSNFPMYHKNDKFLTVNIVMIFAHIYPQLWVQTTFRSFWFYSVASHHLYS